VLVQLPWFRCPKYVLLEPAALVHSPSFTSPKNSTFTSHFTSLHFTTQEFNCALFRRQS
jgi:hypothetical protein